MAEAKEVMDTFNVIKLLWSSRVNIIRNVSIVTLFSVVLALLLPVWYSSGATILPPTAFGGSSLVGMGGVSGAISALGLGSSSEELNMYISLLKSRRIRSKLIAEFGLLDDPYDFKLKEDALDYLDDVIEVEISDEGGLSYWIYDKDAQIAYAMANAILKELGETTVALGTSAASRSRRFVEHRIKSIEADLLSAEQEMHEFAAKYGIFNLPVTIPSIISQLVEFEVKLAESEVEYSLSRKISNDNSSATLQLKAARDALKIEFEKLIHGDTDVSVIPNMNKLPDMLVEYAQVMRDMEIAKIVLEFLYPQYEQARLQEEKDEPTLHVLDYPEIAEKKSKPQRLLIVLSALIFSTLVACAWVIIDEQLKLLNTGEAG